METGRETEHARLFAGHALMLDLGEGRPRDSDAPESVQLIFVGIAFGTSL